jgi:hypothetical protein
MRGRCTTTRLAGETQPRPQMCEVEADDVELEAGEVAAVSEWSLVYSRIQRWWTKSNGDNRVLTYPHDHQIHSLLDFCLLDVFHITSGGLSNLCILPLSCYK